MYGFFTGDRYRERISNLLKSIGISPSEISTLELKLRLDGNIALNKTLLNCLNRLDEYGLLEPNFNLRELLASETFDGVSDKIDRMIRPVEQRMKDSIESTDAILGRNHIHTGYLYSDVPNKPELRLIIMLLDNKNLQVTQDIYNKIDSITKIDRTTKNLDRLNGVGLYHFIRIHAFCEQLTTETLNLILDRYSNTYQNRWTSCLDRRMERDRTLIDDSSLTYLCAEWDGCYISSMDNQGLPKLCRSLNQISKKQEPDIHTTSTHSF